MTEVDLSGRWPDDLSTGIPELDDAHRQIHRLLCGLYQTLAQGPVPADLMARVQALETLMLDHFAAEEALMERQGYPHLAPHRADHQAQVERTRALAARFQVSDASPLHEMAALVLGMVMDHVRQVDLDFARWEHLRRLEGGA